MLGMFILGCMFSIVHSTDGGVDDFATSALIAAAQEKNVREDQLAFDFPAIIITNADCEPISALAGYQKTIAFLSMPTEVGLSSSRVWTPFPWQWRMQSEAVNRIPCLNHFSLGAQDRSLEGNCLLAKVLKNSQDVKIIATGPLTSVADVLKSHPELISKISEIHWMGGAIDIPGNILDSPEIPKELLNDKAEWNVFCDPAAADWIFNNTSMPIHLYPTDISDTTIPADFVKILRNKPRTAFVQFVDESYQIVENIPEYRMWDVVAAAGVLFPAVFNPPQEERLKVVVTGVDEGALIRDANGRKVFFYKQFKQNNPQFFYEAVADMLAL